MDNRLQELLERIKRLEEELSREIQKKEEEFFYKIRGRKICFEEEAKRRHRRLAQTLRHYLRETAILNLLTAPVIWFCLLPALCMDLTATLYQAICFPVYGIPKVNRGRHVVIDRHALRYLNPIEKLNCVYCGYFNGMTSYIQEIAARTEQYWCPIKHARKVARIHSRYHKFLEYGDAERYRRDLERIRRDFKDLA